MPTYLNQPLYPGGFPVIPDNIIIEGKSVKDLTLRYHEGEATEKEQANLKEYVIYYIGAPCFSMLFDSEDQEDFFKTKLSLDAMLDLLLDAGLDPL